MCTAHWQCHLVADFVNNLRRGQLPLTGIATAGINQRFVLAQDERVYASSFIVPLPVNQ